MSRASKNLCIVIQAISFWNTTHHLAILSVSNNDHLLQFMKWTSLLWHKSDLNLYKKWVLITCFIDHSCAHVTVEVKHTWKKHLILHKGTEVALQRKTFLSIEWTRKNESKFWRNTKSINKRKREREKSFPYRFKITELLFEAYQDNSLSPTSPPQLTKFLIEKCHKVANFWKESK